MAAIELHIIEPQNNQAFTGVPNVTFSGESDIPVELDSIPLYYRWYSSLFEPEPPEDRYSMNVMANTSADVAYAHTFAMGTHVITFAVSDVAGETADEFAAIQYGSVTGGSAEGENQCLVHVFKANILLPWPDATMPHNSVQLQAEAPSQWGRTEDVETELPLYILNEDYHAVNRLHYRWVFEPSGAPAGRPMVEFVPSAEDLSFQPMDKTDPATIPTRVSWTVSLPDDALGAYYINLYVEDNLAEITEQHTDQITVEINEPTS